MQYFFDRRGYALKEVNQKVRVVYASFLTREEFLQLRRVYHSHDDALELVLILSGTGLVIIDGIPCNVTTGDIIIYNRNSCHQENADLDSGFSLYAVAATGIRLPGLPDDHICDKNAPKVLHTEKDFEKFRMLFSRIFNLVRIGDYRQTQLLDNYMKVLIDEVILNCNEQKQNTLFVGAGKKKVSEEILEWLNAHYKEKITLQDVANSLSLSPGYVSHVFKDRYGYPPMQYVNYLRIGKAQIRLIGSNDRIADIAMDVGFNNIGNFNRTFLSLVGLTPRDFRKAHSNM